jgi:choice-of-anchor B domain-containing protein
MLFSFYIKAQQNIELAGDLEYPEGLSDIWGYTDSTGIEYALVAVKGVSGQSGGLSVVSLSDPANPDEVYFASGTHSVWRDIKTYNGYAYVTTEADDGLMIVNLNSLPDETGVSDTTFWGDNWTSAHNLYIDENGIMYIFGSNRGNGGVIMYDLNDTPLDPEELGSYEAAYVHDGMARGDTLYTGNVYLGTFSAVDVSDKNNPVYLGGAETPNAFCHNVWVSDDGDYVFTTDEQGGAYITGYNITDMDDVEETDRVQYDPGSNTIVHNVHVYNDYLVTSYYKAGITIHDATDPENLVQTGHYDTSPLSGGGFDGAWGVYPFFSSETIVVSDINEGLFVLTPSYTRASRLEGLITDGPTGNSIFDAKIEILNTEIEAVDNSDVSGYYKTGMAEEGLFDVLVQKNGYDDVLVEGVSFTNGVATELNVIMGDVSSSVNEINWSEVNVYPNPMNEQLNISIPSNSQLENIEIVINDLSGKEVFRSRVNTQNEVLIFDPELTNGIYIVNIYSNTSLLFKEKVSVIK